MSDFRLDEEEQQIEDSAEEFVPVDDEERARIEQIPGRTRKNKNINIRVSETDLQGIRARAEREEGTKVVGRALQTETWSGTDR